jgi:hypothetical protein
MNSSAKTWIVRHIMPQVADITGCYPGSEVYARGFGNYDLAVENFWHTVRFAIAMSNGKHQFVITMPGDDTIRAVRVDDERDVIKVEPTKYGAEGRGVGTGYWAEVK